VRDTPSVADKMYARIREAKHDYEPRTRVLDNGNTAHISICSCGFTCGMSIRSAEAREMHAEHVRQS
jgi:hypothetical protein